jgi:hypothetical protein
VRIWGLGVRVLRWPMAACARSIARLDTKTGAREFFIHPRLTSTKSLRTGDELSCATVAILVRMHE